MSLKSHQAYPESAQLTGELLKSIGPTDVFLTCAVLLAGFVWLYKRNRSQNGDLDDYFANVEYIDQTDDADLMSGSLYEKMKATDRNMVVFYGSQTGTAEEFANRIAKEANRYGMRAMTADPEEVNFDSLTRMSDIDKSLCVFCLATYGEGDPTDNARGYYEWLKRGESDLNGLNYAVFGLGNKTYEHYNSVGIYSDARLAELNGNRICELGLGDDDGMIEDDFIVWKEKFWTAVCDKFNLAVTNDTNYRQYELVVHKNREDFYTEDGKPKGLFTGEPYRIGSYESKSPPYGLKNPIKCKPINYRELYKGDRSCLHVEFDLNGEMVGYKTGDHLVVFPQIDGDLVEMLGRLLNIDLDEIISMKCIDTYTAKTNLIPCPCTFRTAFSYYVDIAAIPRVQPLREMCSYATDEKDQKFMEFICSSSTEGREKYNEWIVKSCRNIVQVINDLPSFRPPADLLIELLPRLQPRYYSISSSNLVNPTSVSITAVVVEYKTLAGHLNKGVATSYLKRNTLLQDENKENGMIDQVKVPICFVQSQFRLPPIIKNTMAPIIMVGPGTGLAPFRGFLQEISFLRKRDQLETSDVILYYGCRHKDQDYLYSDELEQFVQDGTLTQLRVAFSRDQPEKVYVTHLLEQNRAETWDIIGNRNGYVYVCGEARSMAKNVLQIFKNIIMENLKTDEKGADAYLKKMEHDKRYKADVWS